MNYLPLVAIILVPVVELYDSVCAGCGTLGLCLGQLWNSGTGDLSSWKVTLHFPVLTLGQFQLEPESCRSTNLTPQQQFCVKNVGYSLSNFH